jgi:ABC-type polar amino acid transport system ATPase subunit
VRKRVLSTSSGFFYLRFNLFPHLTAVENVVLSQMHAAAVDEREAVGEPYDC